MTIERRAQITAGVLVLFVFATVLLLFWTSRYVERGIRVSESVSQLIRYSYMLSTLLNEYHDYGNIRALEQWEKNRELLGQTLNEMESEYRSISPELQETVQNAFEGVNALSPQIPRLEALRTGDSQAQRARDMLASLMFLRLEQLLKGANDLNRAAQATVLERRHFVEKTILIGGISLLVIVLVNIYLIRKSVVQPLKALSEGAERIDAGKFDYVAETKHDDEVGRLALAFNSMVGRLRDHAITLNQSEERLKQALEVGQLGSWGLNVKTGSAWRTLRHDRIFGYQQMLPEWTYRMFLDHVLPEDVKAVDDRFNEALRTQTEWNFECRIRRVDGVERWIWAQGLPRFDDQGELTEMVGLVQDITDRKKTENELRESEKRYRRLHESISDAIVHTDMSGRLMEFNKAYEDMLGYSQEELLQLTYIDLTPAKWHAFESMIVSDEILPYGRSRVYEKEYICKSGKILPVELRTFLIADDTGSPSGMWAIVRDVTERKNAQEALQKAHDELELRVQERTAELARASEAIAAERQRFYDILETMPEMVCLLTPDHHYAFVNRSFREKFGDDDHKHCFDRVFGKKEPCEFCEAYTVLETGKPHHWEVETDDGSIIDVYNFPFADADGSPLILEIDIDITEQRRAQEKLSNFAKEIEDLYNNAPCGYHSLDSNGVFQRINDTELSWLGYTREEIVGKMRGGDLCDPESRKLFEESYPGFIERGWIKDLQFNLARKDGTTFPVLF